MPTTSPTLPKLLTIPEVATHLRLCTKTVRQLIKSKVLPASRVGKQWRISERDMLAYLSRTA